MVLVHGLRGLESDSIGIYELVPDDDVLAQAGREGMKTSRPMGYNADLPAWMYFAWPSRRARCLRRHITQRKGGKRNAKGNPEPG
jgi:hypothetical protein